MRSREYGTEKNAPAAPMGSVRAAANAVNPMDLVQGLGQGGRVFVWSFQSW
jgi:hypothetical protein